MFHGPPESPGSAPTALSLCLRVGDLLNLHGSELRLKSPVGHPFSGSLLVLCPRETRRWPAWLHCHWVGTRKAPRPQVLAGHPRTHACRGFLLTPGNSCSRLCTVSLFQGSVCPPSASTPAWSGAAPPLCPLSASLSPSLPLSWAVFPPLLLHPLPPTPWPSSHPMLGPSTPDHPQSCFLPWPGTGRSHCSSCPHHRGSPGTGPSSSGSQQGQQPPPPPRAHSYTGGRIGVGGGSFCSGLAWHRAGRGLGEGGRESRGSGPPPRSSYKGRPPVIYRKWVEPGLTGGCAGVDRPHTAQQGGSEPQRSSWTVNTAT